MTDRYAVFGNPVEHSLSPEIHRRFAEQTGEAMAYQRQLVKLEGFDSAAREFFNGGGKGLNITVPFKLEAYSYAGQLSKRSRQAGAVNTLWQQADGTVHGDNTDGVGIARDIDRNLGWPLRGQRILVLGAGGAVRGVLVPLLEQQPARLVVANRSADKAMQLAKAFQSHGAIQACSLAGLEGNEFDLIINGTSAGLSGAVPGLPQGLFAAGAAAYDMVYGASATAFMQWALDQGAEQVADGLGMLVEQAAESFSIWRGVMPETGPVIGALRESLA